MALVITKTGKIRFAKIGDKLKEGERQLFYRVGQNGGFIFSERPPFKPIIVKKNGTE